MVLATQIRTTCTTKRPRDRMYGPPPATAAMAAVEERWSCPKCRKFSYNTQLYAWKAIGVIMRSEWAKKPHNRVPNRVYACPYGQGFHTTSAEEQK